MPTRCRMSAPATAVVAILALLAAGCAKKGGAPSEVAQKFWSAAQRGDADAAQAYVAEGSQARLNFDNEDGGSSIEEFVLGAEAVDDHRATIATQLHGKANGKDLDLAFETVLVEQDGDWRVDLDETSDRMMKSLLGFSMSELAEGIGQAMGEATGDAVESMAEGLAEGLDEAGAAMEEKASEKAADRP